MAIMSWTRFAATVSAAILAGWAATASAADEEFGRSGPHVSFGALYAFENFSGSAKSADDSWGYHIAGGYRFNEYFALELTFDHFVGFDVPGGEANVVSPLLNAKFYPFHGIVQPYVS
ncbi:MAG: outer membrane beta-barrel protein, partial [Candidatus Binatia bacterium]